MIQHSTQCGFLPWKMKALDFKKKYLEVMKDKWRNVASKLRKVVKVTAKHKFVHSLLYRDYKIIKTLNNILYNILIKIQCFPI